MTRTLSFVLLMLSIVVTLALILWGVLLPVTAAGDQDQAAFGLTVLMVAGPMMASLVRALWGHHVRHADADDFTEQALTLAGGLSILVGICLQGVVALHVFIDRTISTLLMGPWGMVIIGMALIVFGVALIQAARRRPVHPNTRQA